MDYGKYARGHPQHGCHVEASVAMARVRPGHSVNVPNKFTNAILTWSSANFWSRLGVSANESFEFAAHIKMATSLTENILDVGFVGSLTYSPFVFVPLWSA